MKKLPKTRRWMSLWRHFYNREETEQQLTESMIRWQEKWNWDFIKLNPPACYHVLDWDADYQFFDDEAREPELRKPVVFEEADVDRISALNVHEGMLGLQLRVIRNLRAHFGPELPIFETVFSPIEIAHRLTTGREALLKLIFQSPAAAHKLLNTITATFRDFCIECMNAGADGIFFATKWATRDLMRWDEYEKFGKAYEFEILNNLTSRDATIVLHVCGERTYLPRMLDYPVDIFSYDFFAEAAPHAADVVKETSKFVCGGIDPLRLVTNTLTVVDDCKRFAKIPKWIAGPSCVINHQATDEAIEKVKRAVNESAADASSA
jgi:uroporphyrinogen decarboxylase